MLERDTLIGYDAPRRLLKPPVFIETAEGRTIKITDEYDIGEGRFMLLAEELEVAPNPQKK
jgi:hypothetical protein